MAKCSLDNLTIFDIEHVILTEKIIARQKDNLSQEWKYIIEGNIIEKDIATVAAKISITNNVVIITAFIGSPYDM